MACEIKINDPIYTELLEQLGNSETALKVYLGVNETSHKELSYSAMSGFKKIEHLLNQRLKKIDEYLKTGKYNTFSLNEEKLKIEQLLKNGKVLAKKNELDAVYTIAKEHLKNIRAKLNSPNLNEQELLSYHQMLGAYNKFTELMESTTEDDIAIEVEAQTLQRMYDIKLKEKALELAQSHGVSVKMEDLLYLQEASMREGLTLDLTDDVNPYIQYVAKLINVKTQERDLFIDKQLKKINELFNKLGSDYKSKLAKASKIFAKDKFGNILRNRLIDKYDHKFYDDRKDLQNNLKIAKEKNNAVEIRRAKRELKEWYNANTISIDPQYFIGSESKKQALKDELINAIGDISIVEEALKKAELKYNEYIQLKQEYEDWLDTENLTTEEKEKNKNQWMINNSPDIFYGMMHGSSDTYKTQYKIADSDVFSSEYVVNIPRKFNKNTKKDTGYYNSDYENIMKDENLKEYFMFLKTSMNDLKNILPDYSKENATSSNYFYRAKADLLATFQNSGFKGFLNKINSNVVNSFTTDFEHNYIGELDENGQELNTVPIEKLRDIDREIKKIQDKLSKNEKTNNLTVAEVKSLNVRLEELLTSYSIDPNKSFEVFLAMASHYKFMSDINLEVQLAKSIVDKSKSLKTNGTFEDPVNLKKRFKYTIDAVLYGKYKDVEGQHKANKDFEDDIFSTSDLIGITSSKKERAKELVKLIKKNNEKRDTLFLKSQDTKLTKLEKEELTGYETLIDEYRALGGKRFTWSSFFDNVIAVQALKTFSYNPFSAFANAAFGLVTNYVEASGGLNFSFKEFGKANQIVLSSVRKYLSFGTLTTEQGNKITHVVEKLGLTHDVIDIKYGKNRYTENKLAKTLNPYNLMQSSDFIMKSTSAIAIMLKDKIKGKNNEEISLWSAFKEDGSWNEDLFDKQTNLAWNGDNPVKMAEYRSKLKFILKQMHGNFDRNNPVVAKQKVLGRLIGQYRLSWMAEGIEQRFGKKYHNEIIDQDVEGRYTTIKRLLDDNNDLNGNMMNKLYTLLFKRSTVNLSEMEKANIKKTIADLQMYAVMLALAVLLKSFYDDDDDDKIDKGIPRMIANQLLQVENDLIFYTSPDVFTTFTSSLIPAMSIYKDFKKATAASYKYLKDGSSDEEDLDKVYEKWFKAFPFTSTIVKFKTRAEKDMSELQDR